MRTSSDRIGKIELPVIVSKMRFYLLSSVVQKTVLPILRLAMVFAIFSMPGNFAYAASDAQIIRGFNLTVFGAEFSPFGVQSRYIRKFTKPVRLKIHNLSTKNRTRQIGSFIRTLNKSIKGLSIATTTGKANFNLYVVDREQYVQIAREKIYKRKSASIRGDCFVRSVFSRNGIIRSDAVIVSDNGERLFKHCMIEEILQGLGPLNDHPSLTQSMFNDRSKHTKFTRFDRLIVNMLYDPRIKSGSSLIKIQPLLSEVLSDAKR